MEQQAAEAIVHESIHVYDHCRAVVDWDGNCAHHACTEVRAAALSGDCSMTNELYRGNLNPFSLRGKFKVPIGSVYQ